MGGKLRGRKWTRRRRRCLSSLGPSPLSSRRLRTACASKTSPTTRPNAACSASSRRKSGTASTRSSRWTSDPGNTKASPSLNLPIARSRKAAKETCTDASTRRRNCAFESWTRWNSGRTDDLWAGRIIRRRRSRTLEGKIRLRC